MNKRNKILIGIGGFLIGLYLIFLLLPVFLIPVCDKISSELSSQIQKSVGIKTDFNKFRIVTTPKFTVGAKLEGAKFYMPDGDLFLDADNMQIKMSLLPLLIRKIELDVISADKFDLNLPVKQDGHFLIEDCFKAEEKQNTDDNKPAEPFVLPFGLKLSNHLPDFKLKEHNISFIDIKTDKKYSMNGSNTEITDFIVNKSIKIQSEGKLVADDFQAFDYNLKILNKVMPDIDLNDLISSDVNNEEKQSNEEINFNIIDAFKLIKNNNLKASLAGDVRIDGTIASPEMFGNLSLNQISMLVNNNPLPDSNIDIKFNKNKTLLDANFYTAKSENTTLKGEITSGKTPKINIACKSNATLKSIFEIVNTFAKIAGVNDFETLKAKGQLDIDFNLETNLKKLTSDGHLKLSGGEITYGLYDVKIENLISDIVLSNNMILINKLGFSTLSIPFVVSGKVNKDASCDIKIDTSNLPIKDLLISLGQASILKENPITSGGITLHARIFEQLTAPKIAGEVFINNLNLKNIPSDTRLMINPVNINLNSTKTGFMGTIEAANIKAINPGVKITSLNAKATLDEKNINLKSTTVFAGKNEIEVSGKISDYMTDKISLNFDTTGNIVSNLSGNLNPYKMTLDLKYSIPNNAQIIIPGFDKSKLLTNGSVSITGSMMNPILKGQFVVPSLEIPEIPVSMKNLTTNLNGPILLGSASIEEFASGGIKAQNIKTNYQMKGSDFYLRELAGSAFDGLFNGNIIYNMASAKCDVKFSGENMSALKAIEGAAGIRNALSGTLKFDANLAFKGVEYDDMMKTLTGNTNFEIKDGVLANLGGLNTFLGAGNIGQSSVLKTLMQGVSKLAVVKDASEFDYIKGNLTFANAYANLKSVKMSGPLMAYYITGRYQLLNAATNVVILGRLSQNTVNALGKFGDLATGKLTSLIPGLGNLTSSIAKSMNESPKNLPISEIPSLRSLETPYRNFKVEFNGGVESQSSVKSFKWLNEIDTSEIDAASIINKEVVNQQINQAKTELQNTINVAKTKAAQAKEDLKQTKEQAKDLFKSILTVPKQDTTGTN